MSAFRVMQLGSPTGLYGAERWILALVQHLDPAKTVSIVAVIRDDPSLTATLCHKAQLSGFQTVVFNAYGRINWSAVRLLRRYLLDNKIQNINI